MPKWTENATYTGNKTIRGELCYSYTIQGYSKNMLYTRAKDGQLCELDNAMADYLQFIPMSYTPSVPDASSLFQVPAQCNTWCGDHGDCKFGKP